MCDIDEAAQMRDKGLKRCVKILVGEMTPENAQQVLSPAPLAPVRSAPPPPPPPPAPLAPLAPQAQATTSSNDGRKMPPSFRTELFARLK